jgi:hypothetical protein
MGRAFATTAFLIAVLAGCGGDGSAGKRHQDAGPQLDVPIRLANCRDWNQADAAQRLGTVRALTNFAGGPVVGPSERVGNGPVLTDKQAYQLFDSYCAKTFARGFKLYKLYVRAAAFTPRGK